MGQTSSIYRIQEIICGEELLDVEQTAKGNSQAAWKLARYRNIFHAYAATFEAKSTRAISKGDKISDSGRLIHCGNRIDENITEN